ncbi:hypothetical protein [Acidovorax cavernicola]|uniref:hypothetical protein n=1 Tax=Acidovorax cavernicola TaxID=1675792 RepID=UPI0011C3BC87|nr:hypothetical protein [Acidovorax cavernicola]
MNKILVLFLTLCLAACSIGRGQHERSEWCDVGEVFNDSGFKKIDGKFVKIVSPEFQEKAKKMLESSRVRKLSSIEAVSLGREPQASLEGGREYYLVRAAAIFLNYEEIGHVSYEAYFRERDESLLFFSFGLSSSDPKFKNIAVMIESSKKIASAHSFCRWAS